MKRLRPEMFGRSSLRSALLRVALAAAGGLSATCLDLVRLPGLRRPPWRWSRTGPTLS